MVRPSKSLVFLLAGALFLACAVAFVGVNCGSDLNCTASKLALGYLLLGVVVVFAGSIAWSSRAPVIQFALVLTPVFLPISAPQKFFARAPPALF